jgi:predicted ester cyclase
MAMEAPAPKRRISVDQHEKKAQIERVFDVFNRRAFDELDDLFHPDYLDHTPMGDLQGVEAFKDYLKGWLDAFPDGRFELANVIVDGDMAAWQPRFTGTNTGPLMGMPATGKSVDVLGLHMGRLSDDGRPIEHWVGNDVLLMLQQLGMAPQMGEAPAAA